jgi:steroid delta-isomerase-like uncharacterized protein
MSESLQQFTHDLVEAWNSHDVNRAARFYASDYVGNDVAQAKPHRGPEGLRDFITQYQIAFPDFRLSTDETIIDGDRVALAWTARATHRGTMMNIPPTGRAISVRGVSLLTIENDKIQRATYIWDVAGLLRAVGLLPEL